MENQDNNRNTSADVDRLAQLEKENAATGTFAGTNPDHPANRTVSQDNPIEDEEAQNVTDGTERISGKEAEAAVSKATEGMKQGRDR